VHVHIYMLYIPYRAIHFKPVRNVSTIGYWCQLCDRGFRSDGALEQHRNCMHPITGKLTYCFVDMAS
jgi:hypothetical protein